MDAIQQGEEFEPLEEWTLRARNLVHSQKAQVFMDEREEPYEWDLHKHKIFFPKDVLEPYHIPQKFEDCVAINVQQAYRFHIRRIQLQKRRQWELKMFNKFMSE